MIWMLFNVCWGLIGAWQADYDEEVPTNQWLFKQLCRSTNRNVQTPDRSSDTKKKNVFKIMNYECTIYQRMQNNRCKKKFHEFHYVIQHKVETGDEVNMRLNCETAAGSHLRSFLFFLLCLIQTQRDKSTSMVMICLFLDSFNEIVKEKTQLTFINSLSK